MSGEKQLDRLLQNLSPLLLDGEFVFCSFADAAYGDFAELCPVAAVREAEGLTLVIPESVAASRGLDYESVFRAITLRVHSSLDAVGLTAAFAGKLTEHGISANVIAGYYHDHIFVQAADAEKALAALTELARG